MLQYVLGVQPGEFGLVPQPDGWFTLKELLGALHQDPDWRHLRRGMVIDAAQRLAPQELELDQGRIRSRLRQPPQPQPHDQPPAHLYLGLKRRTWPVARQRGLTAQPERPLVLATGKEAALRLGLRRDPRPVLITVQAHQARDQGVSFSHYPPDLFLCDWLPAGCLMGPAISETAASPKSKAAKSEPLEPEPAISHPSTPPGSFLITPEDTRQPHQRLKGRKKQVAWKDERRRQRRRQED